LWSVDSDRGSRAVVRPLEVSTMQPEATRPQHHVAASPPPSRHPVAQAVTDLAKPHTSMLEHTAARGRLRDVVTAYVRALRAEGAHVSDILSAVNGVVRRSLAGGPLSGVPAVGAAPPRVAAEIRDTVRRWTLAAYDRAD
jgi:hypothetical protein